ncbi:transglutaminase family protein [Nocardia sp. NPDC059239]|uniref:transglutaminase-like domain-containing protein n=1 Tax=Nocardia sp. NPDC059239 TaxID=3346785 RepID=UPI0036B37D1B
MTTGNAVAATELFDHASDQVQEFVADTLGSGRRSEADRAVALYYAVRDGIFYEVFDTDLSPVGLRASSVVSAGRGFCLHKSILYVAALRSVGIAARLVSSRVVNHLASPELSTLVGGEEFLHWLVSLWVDGRWIYATPVFNKMLCRLYRIEPLEFDATADSLFHPHEAGKAMTFLGDKHHFPDPRPEQIVELIRAAHPGMVGADLKVPALGSVARQAR